MGNCNLFYTLSCNTSWLIYFCYSPRGMGNSIYWYRSCSDRLPSIFKIIFIVSITIKCWRFIFKFCFLAQEPFIFQRSHSSSYYRMTLEIKIWVIATLVVTGVLFFLGIPRWRSEEMCMYTSLYVNKSINTFICKYFSIPISVQVSNSKSSASVLIPSFVAL